MKSSLVTPLRNTGIRIWVYVDTVSSGCNATDAAFLESLSPRSYRLQSRRLPSVAASYVSVLLLMLADSNALDAFILTRPDLRYAMPITHMDIDWNRTNYAFKDVERSWKLCNMTSDLFIAAPIGHAQPLINAIDASAFKTFGFHGLCNQFNHGSVHFTYTHMAGAIGRRNVRFIESGFCSSDPNSEERFLKCNLVTIERTCRPLSMAVECGEESAMGHGAPLSTSLQRTVHPHSDQRI